MDVHHQGQINNNETDASVSGLLSNFMEYTRRPDDVMRRQDDVMQTAQYVLDRYVTVALCVFGCLGNTMNLLVLTGARYRKSGSVIENEARLGLVALAVSDLLFCIVLLPRGFIGTTHSMFEEKNFLWYYQVSSSIAGVMLLGDVRT